MRIMLACCAGMSTSLVVSKMQDEAAKQGKDYKIWAVEQGQIEDELGNFDVLLLGPQDVYKRQAFHAVCLLDVLCKSIYGRFYRQHV